MINRVNRRESVSEFVFFLDWIPVFTGMTGGLSFMIYDFLLIPERSGSAILVFSVFFVVIRALRG
jgi:hypothetical protein